MQYNNQAYLSLVWKDPKERKQYLIGRLSKGEEFVFKYDDEIKNALKAGFHPLLAFSNLKQEYHSKLMFPSFSSRLPDPKRKDINKILNKYNMDEYDAYTLKPGRSKQTLRYLGTLRGSATLTRTASATILALLTSARTVQPFRQGLAYLLQLRRQLKISTGSPQFSIPPIIWKSAAREAMLLSCRGI